MGLTISSYFTSTELSLQRALEFSRSQRFIDLVEEARRKNIMLRIDGKITTVRCMSSVFAAEQVNDWIWDRPDSVIDLVEQAKRKGIELRMDGKSLILRTVAPGLISEQKIKMVLG